MIDQASRGMCGFPFVNLIYDLWTNRNVQTVLGVSVSFIDATWEKKYIALLCKHHEGGHGAVHVSNEIKKRIRVEYGIAGKKILNNIWTVASDTTGAARNVADHFEDSNKNMLVTFPLLNFLSA